MKIDLENIKKIIIQGNYISREEMKKAEEFSVKQKIELTDYLIKNNLITKDLLGQALAENFKVSYFDLNTYPPSANQVKKIPQTMAEKYNVVLAKEEENKNILVVEDEKPLLEAIKQKLEMNNFSVVTARSVEQAINYLKDIKKIDVIWLDHYLLGKENGLDFVVRIKEENSKWKNIPVIVVSNTVSPEKITTYLRLGINKYYTKADYRLDQIIEDINKFLEEGE